MQNGSSQNPFLIAQSYSASYKQSSAVIAGRTAKHTAHCHLWRCYYKQQ